MMHFANSANSDALDALAAVASQTPHSPAPPATPATPATPMTTRIASVRWLYLLAKNRPETLRDDYLTCPAEELPTSKELVNLFGSNKRIWGHVVTLARSLSACLIDALPRLDDEVRKRQTFALYFASIEAILTREATRLAAHRHKFNEKLLRNDVFHKSILTCAWEATADSYGNGGMEVFMRATHVFNLSPFNLTKAVESFVMRLPDMPKVIAKHVMACDARIMESLAWSRSSELVKMLVGRRRRRMEVESTMRGEAPAASAPLAATAPTAAPAAPAAPEAPEAPEAPAPEAATPVEQNGERNEEVEGGERKKEEDKEGMEDNDNGSDEKKNKKKRDKEQRVVTRCSDYTQLNSHPHEFALELFYRKILLLANRRLQELLDLLHLQAISEPVWQCLKHALWNRWELLVDRHLDQILMACVYGVSKVLNIPMQFKDIIKAYRNMGHTRHPSFSPLIPAVFRSVNINRNPDVTAPLTHPPPRGDIIRFYNLVFLIPMKSRLLALQCGRIPSPVVRRPSSPVRPNSTGPANSSNGSSDATALTRDAEIARTNRALRSVPPPPPMPEVSGGDRLGQAVLNSPMRRLGTIGSPRQYGPVTVSPMSPLRQSPGRTHLGTFGSMTPGTRRLFAFGESPINSFRPRFGDDRQRLDIARYNPDRQNGNAGASMRKRYLEFMRFRRSGSSSKAE